MLAAAPTLASAASSLSFSLSPNPVVDGTSATVTASGSSDQSGDVWISDHGSGAAACPSDPSQDPGALISADAVSGSYSVQQQHTPTGVGEHTLCGWLMPYSVGSGTPLATGSIQFSVSPQSGTLTFTVVPGQTITAHYSVNAPMALFVDLRPESEGPCAVNRAGEPAGASDLAGNPFEDPNGNQLGFNFDNLSPMYSPGSITYQAGFENPGTYRVCGWLQRSVSAPPYDSTPVVAGPATTTFTVTSSGVGGPSGPVRRGRGWDSQHRRITITTQGNQIISIYWTAHFRCARTVYLNRGPAGLRWNGDYTESLLFGADTSLGALVIKGNGHFGASLTGNRRHTFRIWGRRVGSRLTGTFHETMKPGPLFGFMRSPGNTCRTGAVRFHLVLRG